MKDCFRRCAAARRAPPDENELAFLYQDEKASGEDGTFFNLVNRDGN